MIAFEVFDKMISNLVKKRNNREAFLNDLNKVFPNSFEKIYKDDCFEEAINLLALLMDDEDGWIEYYFFECGCTPFTYLENDKERSINTNEELYMLIANNGGE